LNGRNKTVTKTNGVSSKDERVWIDGESPYRRTNQIIQIGMYLIGAIVGGILIGWGIGNYLLDRYINETQDEINDRDHTKK
jgi:F0F1-type ATP synthase assembly protein I